MSTFLKVSMYIIIFGYGVQLLTAIIDKDEGLGYMVGSFIGMLIAYKLISACIRFNENGTYATLSTLKKCFIKPLQVFGLAFTVLMLMGVTMQAYEGQTNQNDIEAESIVIKEKGMRV